jgi:hypothetical protein
MIIKSESILIEVVNESKYSLGSADNIRNYPSEIDLSEDGYHSSKHGLVMDGDPVALCAAAGGGTTVHDHSAVLLEGRLYLAVGDHIVCFDVRARKMCWALPIDHATCFGVYYNPTMDALTSHGELEISRFTRDGHVVWASSGEDIFTEGIHLKSFCVEAVDFNGKRYSFDYDSGEEIRT